MYLILNLKGDFEMSREHELTVEDMRDNASELNKHIADLGMQEICRVDYAEDMNQYKFTQMVAIYDIQYDKKENKCAVKEGSKPMNSVEYYDDLMIVVTQINILAATIGVPGARF